MQCKRYREERGSLHLLGLFIFLGAFLGIVLLFAAWSRVGQLEYLIAGQEKRIHELELKVEVLSLKSH